MNGHLVSLFLSSLLLQTPIARCEQEAQPKASPKAVQQTANQTEAERRRQAFLKGHELLTREGVPFDPNILLGPNWKQQLKLILNEMPQMQIVRQGQTKLKGAQLAHTLYLPEKISLEGDTVILARYIVFAGRNVVIKGNHDIHIFVVERTEFTDNVSQIQFESEHAEIRSRVTSIPETPSQFQAHITIDTSGSGRDEWFETVQARKTSSPQLKRKSSTYNYGPALAQPAIEESNPAGADGAQGSMGPHGQKGGAGPSGADGTCSENINGSDGVPGGNGIVGSDGRKGSNGANGNPAGNISITVFPWEAYTLIAKGGRGGNGGDGGRGGAGGVGGTGGKGGYGASCNCKGGRGSIGGRGGRGGLGGLGGDGGAGGNGGKGGDASTLAVYYAPGYEISKIKVIGSAGSGGTGGRGGQGGIGGVGGTAGKGGHGASGFSCIGNGNEGQNGDPGNGGNHGDPGAPGKPGRPGNPGSVSFARFDEGLSWTRAGIDDAWLSLDRDGTVAIDSDLLFSRARLCQEPNHNRLSQQATNAPLSLNLKSISLRYKEPKWMDRYG